MAMRTAKKTNKQTNNSKKNKLCMSSTLFVHNSLSLFCMSKPWNFLVTRFMEKMSYFLTKHYFCCLCSCSFFFFTASHFSSCWPLAFLIFSLLWTAIKFSCYTSSKIFSLICFLSLPLALSVISMSVYTSKCSGKKDSPMFFFTLKM